jgi:hypothetical protein
MNPPRAAIAQEVFYIVTKMNGRTIPNDQQLLFKTLNQVGQKQDTLRSTQGLIAHELEQMAVRCDAAHDRQVVTRMWYAQDGRRTTWGVLRTQPGSR